MSTFAVFHNTDFLNYAFKEVDTISRTILFKVADVECDCLEKVFELTNHIDTEWWNNKEVTIYGSNLNYRSTSVGDVVYSYDEKNYYICLSLGWKLINLI